MSKRYTYEEVNDVIDTDEIIKNAFIRIKECIYEEIINNIKDAELSIFDTHNDCIIDEVLEEFTIERKPKQEYATMFVDVDDMLSFLNIRPDKDA